MPRQTTILALLLLLFGAATLSLAQSGAPDYRGPIYAGPELDYQPSIIRLQPGGQLMVVLERIDPASFSGDFYVTFSSDNGVTWTTPVPAIASPLNERHPALVQLGADSFALFYLVDEAVNSYRLHRATSSDGLAWTDQGMIDLGWATPGEINPSVIREPDGTLTMTYHRLSGPSYIAQSHDDGATWDTQKTQVSNANAQLPRLARRACDGLYLVTYQVGGSNLDLYAKVSSDPYDWSGPQIPVSTAINTHDSQPIVLEDGTFLVAYAMAPVNYFDLFYRTSSDGVTWSDEVQVTNDPTRYDTQPHPILQGTPGHIILTWSHQVSSTPYQDHDVYIETDLAVGLAGLDATKRVEPAFVGPAGLLTYTLRITNPAFCVQTADLTDPIPPDTAYEPGSLWASGGDYGFDAGSDTITWTGAISAGGQVTITFQVSTALNVGDGQVLTNTAAMTDGAGMRYTLVATATADTQPPASLILDPLEGQWISQTEYLIQGVASDTVSGIAAVAVSVDGSLWQPALGGATWAITWTLPEGAHNARSRAADGVGHVEAPRPGVTFTVDATPPLLSAHSPAAGAQDVPLTATVVLTFSEPIVPETMGYAIAPDPGGWSVAWDAQNEVAYLSHDAFTAGQAYTFTVAQAHDRARNGLGPVAWPFHAACAAPQGVHFAYLPAQPYVYETVHFSGSVAAGTPPLTYTWTFGDGTPPLVGPSVSHAYTTTGSYSVTLAVTNGCGQEELQQVVWVRAYTIYLPVVLRGP